MSRWFFPRLDRTSGGRAPDRRARDGRDRTAASVDFNRSPGLPGRPWALAVLLVVAFGLGVGCQQHNRRHDPSPPGPSQTGDYEASGDPRFPRKAPDRTGWWYEEPSVQGGLSHSVVLEVADTHRSEIEGCLPEDARQQQHPEGRLVVALEVGESGGVQTSDIRETSIYEQEFTDCVLESTKNWSFDPGPSRSGATVYLPINVRWDDEAEDAED